MVHDSALFKMTNFIVLDRYSFRSLPVSQRRKNASVARVVQRVVSHLLQCDEQGTFIDLGAQYRDCVKVRKTFIGISLVCLRPPSTCC